MTDTFSILVAGVGGQGNLVVGQVLSEAAATQGLQPVVGQTFGASRRGGTVFTHIRIADYVVGPMIPVGHVDCVIGLEPLETLRAVVQYCGKETTVIMSTKKVETILTMAGADTYPEISAISKNIEMLCNRLLLPDISKLDDISGASRMLNTFMLGVFAGLELGHFSVNSIRQGIISVLGADETNSAAFNAGVDRVRD